MKYYTIDFTGTADLSDFYQRIIKGLDFPDWCGENPDAVWDLLSEYPETPAHITITGSNNLPGIFAQEIILIKEVFDRAAKWSAQYNEQLIFVYK